MKYRVKMVESERGWGKEYFDMDFPTPEEARSYLEKMKKKHDEDYKQNRGIAPDYYVLPVDGKVYCVFDD